VTWALSAVPPEYLKESWPTVAPLLAPAVGFAGGRISLASVFDWIQDGRYVLWVAYESDSTKIKAAFVTREARYPCRKMLAIDGAGGEGMTEWLPAVVDTFRRYARDAGLDGVEMFGRVGWVRALRATGWVQTGVLCEVNAAAGDDI